MVLAKALNSKVSQILLDVLGDVVRRNKLGCWIQTLQCENDLESDIEEKGHNFVQ